MLKSINPKKLTAKTLIGIFIAGSLVTQVGTNKAIAADTCENNNNGHGDNLAASVTLSSGDVVTVTKYDPTNPGNKRNQLKNLLKDGETSGNGMTIAYSNGAFELSNSQADYVLDNIPDIEANCDSASSTPTSLILTGTLRDFKGYRDINGNISTDGHEDFERKHNVDQSPSNGTFKYGLDTGITTNSLGLDKKPVYAGGSYSTTTQANFDQWYRDVPGVNQSMPYDIELTKIPGTDKYSFDNNGQQFFPLDGLLMGNEGRNHNFHFTYELHTKFTYQPGQTFNVSGDDDVWVYINGQKVIDIGGVHGKTYASVNLDSLGLTAGTPYDLDFFFAERHVTQSNFKIETTVEFIDPNTDSDGDGFKNDVDPDPYVFTYPD